MLPIRLAFSPILMPCESDRILPTSLVSATCTSTPRPAMDSTPTEFSGLLCHGRRWREGVQVKGSWPGLGPPRLMCLSKSSADDRALMTE